MGLGRREQALQATGEADEIYRGLADANPAAFKPDIARALWAFAWVRAAGQIELSEALTAAQEANEVFTRLAWDHPGTFTYALQGTMRTMADVLDGLNRHAEADEVRRSLDDE